MKVWKTRRSPVQVEQQLGTFLFMIQFFRGIRFDRIRGLDALPLTDETRKKFSWPLIKAISDMLRNLKPREMPSSEMVAEVLKYMSSLDRVEF
jgi:hypothetical protein